MRIAVRFHAPKWAPMQPDATRQFRVETTTGDRNVTRWGDRGRKTHWRRAPSARRLSHRLARDWI